MTLIPTAQLRQMLADAKKAKCSRDKDNTWEYEIHPSNLIALLEEVLRGRGEEV